MNAPVRKFVRKGHKTKRLQISPMLLARAKSAGKPVVTPWLLAPPMPLHPPGVVAKGKSPVSLAMDAEIAPVYNWAAQVATNSFFQEGLTFLGYPYLSELAQRPEYRVISETIATEMTRNWIKVSAKGDDDGKKADKISKLNDAMERLHVQDVFRRLIEQDGFFGRSHLYIDTGDTDNRPELLQDIGDGINKVSQRKIKRGSLERLATVEPVWCYPTNYNSNDPLKESWYNPSRWWCLGKEIHSSRLIRFVGREVPDLLKPAYSFGGLSLSQMAKPYVDNWLETRQSVNAIIHAFSVFVLGTNLGESTQADGGLLFERLQLFNQLRDNLGVMAIDKDSEEFQNVAAPLSGLDELQAQAQEHMAAVSGIPIVKLLGISPHGLNASTEGELRAFYDRIHAFQERFLRAPITSVLGFIQLSEFGSIDEDIVFDFEQLWELNEKEQSEVEKIKAETDQLHIDSGVISPEEARKRVATDPDSGYDSIDVDDVPDLKEEEEEGLDPSESSMTTKGGGSTEDAALDALFNEADHPRAFDAHQVHVFSST